MSKHTIYAPWTVVRAHDEHVEFGATDQCTAPDTDPYCTKIVRVHDALDRTVVPSDSGYYTLDEAHMALIGDAPKMLALLTVVLDHLDQTDAPELVSSIAEIVHKYNYT